MATVVPTRKGTLTTYITSASWTFTVPAGVSTGDWMILVINQLTSTGAPSTPTGWTARQTVAFGTRSAYAFTKVKGSETEVTVTRAGAGAATLELVYGSGALDPSSWLYGAVKNRVTAPTESTTSTALSVTTTTANSLALGFLLEATTTAEATAPTLAGGTQLTYAAQQGTTNIETVLVGYKEIASPGASGNMVATYPNAQASNGAGFQIVVVPVEQAVTVPGLAIKVGNASKQLVDGRLLLAASSTSLVTPTQARVTPSGLLRTPLLAKNGFVIAHRGGSVNYAEMSKQAYLNSMFCGAHALEFSIARTIDGVFYGLHDETVNRTSPGAPANFVASEHTWAETQVLLAKAGGDSGQLQQPYYRFDEFAARFPKHAKFVDPKYVQAQYFSDLLNIMDANGGPEGFVGKSFYSMPQFAAAAKLRGYSSWGYAYQTNYDTDPNVYQNMTSFDYVGVEYTAGTAFTAALATGKPVIAHIAENVAAYQTAMSKGARGVMVSAIRQVTASLSL